MSKFFDGWVHAHRLSRAVFMAIFAGGCWCGRFGLGRRRWSRVLLKWGR